MKKIFFLFLSFSLAFAEPYFAYTHKFVLKKDEKASIEIIEAGFEDQKRYFDFSWTLFDNTNIIVLSKYNKFPRQLVLSLRRNLNWAVQTLVPDYKNPQVDRARLILEFSEFKKGKATFIVYIEDKDGRIVADFKQRKK